MNITSSQLIISIILLALSILSGLWLKKLESPYPVFLVTIHKLVSLASVVLFALTYLAIRKHYTINPNNLKVILAGLAFSILSFASGALLTNVKTYSLAMVISHRVTTICFILTLFVAGYLIYTQIFN